MQTIQTPSRFDQLAKQIAYSRSAVDHARASMSAKAEYDQMKEAQKMAKAIEAIRRGTDERTAFQRAGFGGQILEDILASRKLQRMKAKEEMAGLKEIERARKQGLTLEELREKERKAIRRQQEENARQTQRRVDYLASKLKEEDFRSRLGEYMRPT